MRCRKLVSMAAWLSSSIWIAPAAAQLGIFEDHGDVGRVLHAGSVQFDAAQGTYAIAGNGENMWFASDAFQFVWKKLSGDVTLTADISFIGGGQEAHRKAVLMIRQNLDPDSPYADVARHGDGLTSLQGRDEKGANTSEVQSAINAPARVRIAKRGDWFYMWVAAGGEPLQFSGAAMRIPLRDPFYVGLGVCSHNKDVIEKAVFSNVDLNAAAPAEAPSKLYSTLETVPLSGDRRVVYVSPGRLTAPVWTPDGAAIVFRSETGLRKVPLTGGRLGQRFGFAYSGPDPSLIGSGGPSLDAKLPSDGLRSFYPRLSPDGQQIAFLSGAGDQPGVPEDQEIMLRVLSLKDGKVRVLAKFNGGKGSTPSWSPDSRRLAFVSYPRIP